MNNFLAKRELVGYVDGCDSAQLKRAQERERERQTERETEKET